MIVKAKITGKLNSNAKVAEVLRTWLAAQSIVDQDKEHFWAIGLDIQLKVKYIEVVTMGPLDASLVHPREVFRFAIMNGVASIIVGHNGRVQKPDLIESEEHWRGSNPAF